MTASARYRQLTERLLEDESWGTLSEDEDEKIRSEMDGLWWQMTAEERADADAWLSEQRAKAPESLGLVELIDADGGPVPRRPAAA